MTAGSPWQSAAWLVSAEDDPASYAVSPTLSVRDFEGVVGWPFHSPQHLEQTTAADAAAGTGKRSVGNQAQGTVRSVQLPRSNHWIGYSKSCRRNARR